MTTQIWAHFEEKWQKIHLVMNFIEVLYKKSWNNIVDNIYPSWFMKIPWIGHCRALNVLTFCQKLGTEMVLNFPSGNCVKISMFVNFCDNFKTPQWQLAVMESKQFSQECSIIYLLTFCSVTLFAELNITHVM